MTSQQKPSTAWKEKIAPDEELRFAEYGRQMVALQQRKSKKQGNGRALHRKQLTAVQGSLRVLNDLPGFSRHGLFAQPGTYEVWARLSNGGMDRAADAVPDIRGFAFKVFGVTGDSALGNGPALSQDFSLINQSAFGFTGSADFIDFVLAASNGGGALLKHLVKRYGLIGGPARLLGMLKKVGRPFKGFGVETLYSAVPIACGPYAVRLRLVPSDANGPAAPDAKQDWGRDFAYALRSKALEWDLQLQPFVSEDVTPIEDASVDWPTPYTTVARLTVHKQDVDSAEGQALLAKAEAGAFDPWQALAEHRPLGDVQRARKVVYFESQKARGSA